MNKNTAGALLVLILAAAGLVYDKPWAWVLAALSAALAFLTEELRSLGLSGWAFNVGLASWAAVVLAFNSLLF